MSILKVNTIMDKGGNTLLSSDGAGTISSGGAITNTPAFNVYLSADQSLSSGATTLITFDTVEFDTANCYSTSTSRFTPTVAGKYWIYSQGRPNTASDQDSWELAIYKNGTKVIEGTFRNEYYDVMSIGKAVEFNGTTDYAEVKVYQNTGGAVNWAGGTRLGFFGAYKLIGA